MATTTQDAFQNKTSSIGINVELPLQSVQLYQYLIGKPGELLMAANARISLLLNMTVTDPLYDKIEGWYRDLMCDSLCQLDGLAEQIQELLPKEQEQQQPEVIPPIQIYSFFYTAQSVKLLSDVLIQLDQIMFSMEKAFLHAVIDRESLVEIILKCKAILTNVRIRMYAMTNIGKRDGSGAFEAKLFLNTLREREDQSLKQQEQAVTDHKADPANQDEETKNDKMIAPAADLKKSATGS